MRLTVCMAAGVALATAAPPLAAQEPDTLSNRFTLRDIVAQHLSLGETETLRCDVLIVGGGGAGLGAAIAARERGGEVILVTKGRAGYQSNTFLSKAVRQTSTMPGAWGR